MKKLFTLILIVFSSSTIFSQDITEIPFQKANTIVIRTQIPDDSLYIIIGKKLAASGFSIDINNRDFLQFKTGKKDTVYPELVYVLTVSISNKEAFIKPTMISKGHLGI